MTLRRTRCSTGHIAGPGFWRDAASDRAFWTRLAESIRQNVRKRLWDAKRTKFRPHVYLDRGSPFPAGFDEDRIHYHGGTTVAMEAGLLSAREVGVVLEQMRANRQAVGAGSIGLTIHPVYPEGLSRNPQVRPFGYRNGGDWTWFGGRTIRNWCGTAAWPRRTRTRDRIVDAGRSFAARRRQTPGRHSARFLTESWPAASLAV